MQREASLDRTFRALADRTRRSMIHALAAGDARSAGELGRQFHSAQPTISRHLKVLEEAGLISRRVDGTRRPCRLTKNGLASIDQWLAMMRAALSANYDRLDTVLAELDPQQGKDKP